MQALALARPNWEPPVQKSTYLMSALGIQVLKPSLLSLSRKIRRMFDGKCTNSGLISHSIMIYEYLKWQVYLPVAHIYQRKSFNDF